MTRDCRVVISVWALSRSVRTVSIFGGEQFDFAAQRIEAGGGFGQQFGLGLVIPLEGFNLGAGIG